MKKLILVQNDCPRSGKSTVASAIANLLKHHGVGFNLVSTDEDKFDDPDFLDLEDFETSVLIGLIDHEPITIIDVATGTSEALADVFAEYELEDLLAELDVDVTVVLPITANEKSLSEAIRIGETYSDGADYVVVKTGAEPNRLHASEWKNSYAAKAMGYLGAIEVEFPPASPALYATLKEHQISLSNAASNPSQLPAFAKTEIGNWFETCFANMTIAHDYLVGDLASVPDHVLRYVSSYGISSK